MLHIGSGAPDAAAHSAPREPRHRETSRASLPSRSFSSRPAGSLPRSRRPGP
jgi:hypothetical protein